MDAYLARVRSMHEHGMGTEAGALLSLIRDRYPASRAKLEAFASARTLQTGSIEDLGRLLSQSPLAREQRKEIENALRSRLTDPAALANCSTLPPEHPLRVGAAAICEALAAVTSGPVNDEQIALPEIAHRSPLAPWKALVRAIAGFYGADEEGCERNLQAIDAQSPPARLAPVLRAMISGQPTPRLKPAALALMAQVGGDMEALRTCFRDSDTALRSGKKKRILETTRSALQVCRRAAPDLHERLKQHLAVRLEAYDIDPTREDAALGGPCLKNAYYWLLSARAIENPAEDLPMTACSLWEQFRRHAVHEGQFRADGPEVATLYLHMVELLKRVPRYELEPAREDFIDGFLGYEFRYYDQPDSVRAAMSWDEPEDFYYLYPERLYERACAIDPDPRTFSLWLDWAEGAADRRAADRVAEAWQQALPGDPRPLLYLMESAERRGALKKALGYLKNAEDLDAVNPEVRRARFRLLVGRVRFHLLQRKPHLAEKELSVLGALPQAREGDRPAFLAALRWVSHRIADDRQSASAQLAEACRLLNSEGAGHLLVAGVAEAHKLSYSEIDLRNNTPLGPDEGLAKIVARVCMIGDDIGMRFDISEDWEKSIIGDLAGMSSELSLKELRTLAETGVRAEQLELAYAASAAGLDRPGSSEARFLLLRARALPTWDYSRRRDCFAAAAELARRQGDTALAGEAFELQRGDTRGMGFLDVLDSLEDRGHRSMTAERVDAVLKRERAARSYIPPAPAPPVYDGFYAEFDDDDFDEDDELDELIEDFVPVFGAPGRKVATPRAPAKPPKNQSKAKQTDTAQPEQRSLFSEESE